LFVGPRDFRNRPGNSLGLIVQCQISLRHNADHATVAINDWDATDLMVLHQPFTTLDVLAIATGNWICADEFLDGRRLWIQAIGNDRATEVAVGDHSNQLPRLPVGDYRYRTNIAMTHDPRNGLSAVIRRTTGWIRAHYVSNFHENLLMA
jgi:hypothetical protein